MNGGGRQAWNPALYEQSHAFVWETAGGLLELLEPRAGERILDLGCGTGQLTAKIAETGAEAIGLDSSEEMIRQARENYPDIEFRLGDAASFTLEEPVDAVFSNAALHWVLEAEEAVSRVAAALKPGGRFIAEFGGKGNVHWVLEGTLGVLARHGYEAKNPWYFPSVAEYTALLEGQGFEIAFASLFPRPSQLDDPEHGLGQWLRMFGQPMLDAAPAGRQPELLAEIEDELRPHLFRDGHWFVDYKRIRVKAIRPWPGSA